MALGPNLHFHLVEGVEDLGKGFFIGNLRGGKAGAVHAVVQGGVDRIIDAVDAAAQVLRIEIVGIPGQCPEAAVEHAEDVGGIHC